MFEKDNKLETKTPITHFFVFPTILSAAEKESKKSQKIKCKICLRGEMLKDKKGLKKIIN